MIFNIKSWGDVRAAVYTLLPIATTLLVSYGVLDESQASLWAGLVTAIAGPVIAAFMAKTVVKTRAALYAVLAAGQALFIGYGLVSPETVDMWLPLVSALIGGGSGALASANTDTTPSVGPVHNGPVGKHAASPDPTD